MVQGEQGEINLFKLCYQTNKRKYIATFTHPYPQELEEYLEKIYNTLSYFYSIKNIVYSNECGSNVKFIHENVKMERGNTGKIILKNWLPTDPDNVDKIKSVYGPIHNTIGASYHSLVYLFLTIGENHYHIAIETCLYIPYNLQYYIGTSWENLNEIIQKRYQCNDVILTYDMNKPWYLF